MMALPSLALPRGIMVHMIKTLLVVAVVMVFASPMFAQQPIQSHKKPYPTFGSIERLDPALDKLLAKDAKLEKLAEGFNWSEGPVWVAQGSYLLFSDVPENTVYRWRDGQGVDIYLKPSGYTGDPAAYDGKERGSNGLTLDAQGRLVLCQHGNRQVARANEGGGFTPIAKEYDGKRFNSPNDLCYDKAGNLYFTDPPYGLAKSAKKELDFQGVYRVTPTGEVTLLTQELERPNGIALSPDQKTLYVAQSHGPAPIIMAYPLNDDGTLGEGKVLFNAKPLAEQGRKGMPDGLKVDQQGNLWATGPGGVLIISPEGKHLGTIMTGQATANCAFGDDGSTLYITADMFLCRIRTNVKGTGF